MCLSKDMANFIRLLKTIYLHMKIFSKIFIAFLFLSFILSSCNNTTTYAEQLKAEKELIADFIKRNNITVVTEEPKVWADSIYWLTESGLYFQLTNVGDTARVSDTVKADTLEANDLVVPRFYQITLNAKPDTIFNWNTINFPYPTTFNYLDDSQACAAWHEAVSYMKYNNSRARFIVKSKIGFEDASDAVTPYVYDMKIKFQK